MNTHEFFELLYPDKPADAWLALWRSENKKSNWYQDLEQASEFVEKYPCDIYFQVCLSPKVFGDFKRCSANQVCAAPGLFAEIDVGKKNGPETIEEAEELLYGNGFDPTVVVISGTGLHVYWLFKELLELNSQPEREAVAKMNRRLTYFLKEKAAQQGWNIDSIFDLARLLRPVGSVNAKVPELKRPVLLHKNEGPRYQGLENFDEFLPEVEYRAPVDVKDAKFVINDNAAVPEQIVMLATNESSFNDLWNKKPKKNDETNSGYDFGMCILAAKAEFSDQMMCDMMVAWANKHCLPIKSCDYYARTILNARQRVEEQRIKEQIEEANLLKDTPYEPPDAKIKNLSTISKELKAKIDKVVRFVGENTYYRFYTNRGVAKIKSTKILLSPRDFQAAWAEQLKIVLPMKKAAQWVPIVQMIINCSEDNTADPEAVMDTRMVIWTREYLLDNEPICFKDWERHIKLDYKLSPFVDKNHWFLHPESFMDWTFYKKTNRDKIEKFRSELRDIGAESKPFNVNIYGGKYGAEIINRVTRRFWRIPHEVAHPLKMSELLSI